MTNVNANQIYNLDDKCVPWWPFYPFDDCHLLSIVPLGLKEIYSSTTQICFIDK